MTGHKGQIVGYVRVSAADQNEARQLEAIGDVDHLFSEKVSGKNRADRHELAALIRHVRSGDIVRVKSPDRLARSTVDLLTLIKEIRATGATVEFIDNPELNTNTAQGEFVLTLLAAVAQLERATIRERQAEGIAIAKGKGVYKREPKLSAAQLKQARELVGLGVPKTQIARGLGVSRQTLYTALAGDGLYADVAAAPHEPGLTE